MQYLCQTPWIKPESLGFNHIFTDHCGVTVQKRMNPFHIFKSNTNVWNSLFPLLSVFHTVISLSHQSCCRVWPLPGSWPCQSALCPDRNVGISAAPASLCCWCGWYSVEKNAHRHTGYTLVARGSFGHLNPAWELHSYELNMSTILGLNSRARARALEDSVKLPDASAGN